MGLAKGLLRLDDGTYWVERQLRAFSATGGRRAVLVLGYGAEEYVGTLPWLQAAQSEWIVWCGLNVRVALNARPELGPFSSIMAGLEVIEKSEKTAVWVMPIDVPWPSALVMRQLIAAVSPGVSAVIPEFQGRGGHPVWLAADFARTLKAVPLTSDVARLDLQLQKLPPQAVRRQAVGDRNILFNFNTPAEWSKFREERRDFKTERHRSSDQPEY
jgi:CTP:molybdopterin cytidylyltransferase MocA